MPYIALTTPNSEERTQYFRGTRTAHYLEGPVTVTFGLSQSLSGAKVRPLVWTSGEAAPVPAADPIVAPFRFTLDLAPGAYLIAGEVFGQPHSFWIPLWMQVLVGHGTFHGLRWVHANRHDLAFERVLGQPNVAQVEWTGAMPTPVGAPIVLPPDLAPWSTVIGRDSHYAYHGGGGEKLRWFYETEASGVTVSEIQHYYTVDRPMHLLIDGPRQWATVGSLIDALPHPQGNGFYALALQGRLMLIKRDMSVDTFAGYRTPKDRPAPDWQAMRSGVPARMDWYYSKLDLVGVWEGLERNDPWHRPWGFDMRQSLPPHDQGLHEAWVCNTFRSTIDYVDHRRAHGHDHPEGAGPGEQSDVRTVLSNHPSLDHPWTCKFANRDGVMNPVNDHLYWINRGDATGKPSLWKAIVNLDGSLGDPELVWVSATRTGTVNEVKGFGSALNARTALTKDGPYATATLTLPNAMDFDSNGDLIISEQGTYCLRKVDLRAGTVVTLTGTLPKLSFNSMNEVVFHVDRFGVCGPKDDMLGGSFSARSSFRYAADGTLRGEVVSQTVTSNCNHGVRSSLDSYPWLFCPGNPALPVMCRSANGGYGYHFIGQKTVDQRMLTAAEESQYARAITAWKSAHTPHSPLRLTNTSGYFGYSDWTGLAARTDAEIDAYLAENGLSDTERADVLWAIRWYTRDDGPLVTGDENPTLPDEPDPDDPHEPDPAPEPVPRWVPEHVTAFVTLGLPGTIRVEITYGEQLRPPGSPEVAGYRINLLSESGQLVGTPHDSTEPVEAVEFLPLPAPGTYRARAQARAADGNAVALGITSNAVVVPDPDVPVARIVPTGVTATVTESEITASVMYEEQSWPPETPEVTMYRVVLMNEHAQLFGVIPEQPDPVTSAMFALPGPGTYRVRVQAMTGEEVVVGVMSDPVVVPGADPEVDVVVTVRAGLTVRVEESA